MQMGGYADRGEFAVWWRMVSLVPQRAKRRGTLLVQATRAGVFAPCSLPMDDSPELFHRRASVFALRPLFSLAAGGWVGEAQTMKAEIGLPVGTCGFTHLVVFCGGAPPDWGLQITFEHLALHAIICLRNAMATAS